MLQSGRSQERRVVEVQLRPLRLGLLGQRPNRVVETIDRHAAIRVMQARHHACERVDRVGDRAAVQARVQVMRGADQRGLHVHQASQHRRDRWVIHIPHARVAHDGHIRLQQIAVRLHEGLQARAAAFLLAFKHQRHGAGRPASAGVPRAQRLDEGHHLSLVVHRSARHDARPVRTVHHHRLERRALPQFKRIGRLHVVVPVEEHARRGHALRSRMRRNHHRVAKRGHRVRLEADLAQLRHQPFSAASHIRGEGRVGAHCGDAKERLQALHGLGVVGVGSGKHAVQRCLHARQPIAECLALRALNPRSVGSPHAA